jgi:aerobic carbon-monoxide dehydrogenase small subunit
MSAGPVSITFTVNHRSCLVDVEPHHTLLDVLRDRLGLTGTKECCAEGECGACTVLLNGRAVTSCLVLAAETAGQEVLTIEGLARDGRLGAVQCGFCIPGMIMAAKYLLMTNPRPTAVEIREGLSGNLCRCAGYSRIVVAVQAAAKAAG